MAISSSRRGGPRPTPSTSASTCDFDIPDAYLPEFPPPLFLTTRPDLGDVSRGHEITQANFRELFDGIITPEQMEGLRLLVTKFPTTWFNQTKHRVTKQPVRGTACFDCHVNGHTNGAIALDPAHAADAAAHAHGHADACAATTTRCSSARGARSARPTTSPRSRSISTATSALQPQIGGRQLDRPSTNRMGDFNSIIAWPPAPKLDRFGKLIPAKATPAELRGETLFHGKARCAVCHPAPFYTDNQMHDLRVEEFYTGRAEGWIKTFSLRGIKDSPPYLHDGRLPTLEDTVEFFNLIFELKLTRKRRRIWWRSCSPCEASGNANRAGLWPIRPRPYCRYPVSPSPSRSLFSNPAHPPP